MKTAVGSPEPHNYDKIAANYRRIYIGRMTDIATMLRKAGSIRFRR